MAKILIVEDEKMLADAFQMILEKAGHEVGVAFNGQEGLDAAKTLQPDLILLDLLMPVLDGLGFLKAYGLKKNHPDVKVIIFSNLDMQKEAEEAFTLGASKYVLKAWATPKTLNNIVDEELKK